MTLSRRLFLGAALAAPAIVRAESLMKLWVPPQRILAVDPFGTRGVIEHPRWVGVDFGADVVEEMTRQAADRHALLLEAAMYGVLTRRPMAFPREWT